MAAGLPVLGALVAAVVALGPRPDTLREALADPAGWVDGVGADTAAAAVAGALGWLLAAWLVTGLLVIAASALPGAIGRVADGVSRRVLPLALRRAAAVALGVSLTTCATACAGRPAQGTRPADRSVLTAGAAAVLDAPGVDWPLRLRGARPRHATPVDWPLRGPGAVPLHRAAAPATSVDWPLRGPGAVPAQAATPGASVDWPLRPAGAAAVPATAPAASGPDKTVVVAPGDCLWLIARRREPAATPAEINAATARWYAANRRLIGPDPDLLRPGQALVPPREVGN